ncbi:hypothetical protein Acy02nite_71640 [Actinoplanes cyaneus]|uniref:Peptidase S8 and S53 subtilisin kexin sedolisin n=1 Tax=Actinoplanes cyaneus TaxID=52696 RepID=A0A919ITF6_9ACTN|nr:S8/S53 family peptidase [Actinoplanes cyaneus]MCW2142265.1 hypothetical protein [Actinoplanes cyaneus]GID69283.1 hypothetical protein Acy02nite_71640 [Actinoplanes cyaneus]
MTNRTTVRTATVAVLVAAVTGVSAVPAAAATSTEVSYTVTGAYQDKPENLREIAERFLGDGNRAGEILRLNAGRIQWDDERLTDASRLHEGWILRLPWDAAGAELRYGKIPEETADSTCAKQAGAAAPADRTQLRPPLSEAWSRADGTGITVAILGSGVDGAAHGLAGRVTPGADMAAGTGRGDLSCEGTATTLAGIVAGDREHSGIAPQARILPLKTGGDNIVSGTAVRAIGVAAESGAQVLLIGGQVDADDTAVVTAIRDAIAHDVVVVVPATVPLEPVDGLLLAGADTGTPPEVAAPGAADPAGDGAGIGTDYAAAFVAGTVALVRSAHPGLHAADAARQVRATAVDGVVNPAAAVTSGTPANATWTTPSSGLRTLSTVLIWAGAVLAALVVLAFLLPGPAGALSRRLAHRRALAARARMTGDSNDPFWQPPDPARMD